MIDKNAWKPGAISKSLLRKLNQAKMNSLVNQKRKPLKRSKKRIDDKPTLIVAKKNGEYHIEMQVEDTEGNEQYKPLKYKIASASNQEKIEKRERKSQRLIRRTYEKVFSDPYHPELCQKTCLKAYKQATGLLPYDPNNPECNCSDEETIQEESSDDYETDSTDCNSLDLDWEIHFSPPIACQI